MPDEEKVDRLFLRSNCIECSKVRGEIDFSAVIDDDYRGTKGEELRVYSALSSNAVEELLENFALKGRTVPVIITHDGAVIEKAKNVIMHLRRSGMIK
jgi:hypothetical protein